MTFHVKASDGTIYLVQTHVGNGLTEVDITTEQQANTQSLDDGGDES